MSTPISKSSGQISTSHQVTTGSGVLTYYRGSSGGVSAVYDGTSSTGLLLDRQHVNTAGQNAQYNPPVQFKDGLFVEVTSTEYHIVHYA